MSSLTRPAGGQCDQRHAWHGTVADHQVIYHDKFPLAMILDISPILCASHCSDCGALGKYTLYGKHQARNNTHIQAVDDRVQISENRP